MARIWGTIKIFETSGPKLGLTRIGEHSERDNDSNHDKVAHSQPGNDQNCRGNLIVATDQAAMGPSPMTSYFSAQLSNELSMLSGGPMGDFSSHFFDGTLLDNLDPSTYWQ